MLPSFERRLLLLLTPPSFERRLLLLLMLPSFERRLLPLLSSRSSASSVAAPGADAMYSELAPQPMGISALT